MVTFAIIVIHRPRDHIFDHHACLIIGGRSRRRSTFRCPISIRIARILMLIEFHRWRPDLHVVVVRIFMMMIRVDISRERHSCSCYVKRNADSSSWQHNFDWNMVFLFSSSATWNATKNIERSDIWLLSEIQLQITLFWLFREKSRFRCLSHFSKRIECICLLPSNEGMDGRCTTDSLAAGWWLQKQLGSFGFSFFRARRERSICHADWKKANVFSSARTAWR